MFDVPVGQLTETVTVVVLVPGGTSTRTVVDDVIVNSALVPPNVTLVTYVRCVPCRTTIVPPTVGPLDGVMLVRVAVGYTYVNGTELDVPPGELTKISTVVVGVPGGTVTEIDVGPSTVNVAGFPPNVTNVTDVRLEPWRVTIVPPVEGAVVGVTEMSTGGAS